MVKGERDSGCYCQVLEKTGERKSSQISGQDCFENEKMDCIVLSRQFQFFEKKLSILRPLES